jgi:hypothetical protein
MKWTAPPLWQDGECWIIGGGPSIAKQFGIPKDVVKAVANRTQLPSAYSDFLAPIHGKHVIGINNVYQIGTWIDVLFFGDCSWFMVHQKKLSEWPGLKVTCCNRFERKPVDLSESIKYLGRDKGHKKGISRRTSFVSWNDNSGAASISMAAHFGVKRIILLGFDMRIEDIKSGLTHWHGSHGNPRDIKNKRDRIKRTYNRHLMGFGPIAHDAKKRGIEIINASPESSITDFPKVKLKELL